MNGIKQTDKGENKQARTENENKAALTLGLSDSTKGELFPILSGKNYAGTTHGEALGETQNLPEEIHLPGTRSGQWLSPPQGTPLPDPFRGGLPQSPAKAMNKVGRQQRLTE